MTAISLPISNATTSTASRWTGRVLSGIPVLFLLMDAVMKILDVPVVQAGMQQLGYRPDTAVPLGVVLLVSTILYVVPRTAFLGALLLTGYLGGAVATHVRVGDPLFSHVLFPTYFAAALWAGLFLRDARLRQLLG